MFKNYRGFLLTAALPLLFSCGRDAGKLRLVYPAKVNYEPLMIANAQGAFPDNVDVLTVTSGIHAAEALMTGNADMAALGDGPAVMLMARNAPVKILARYAQGEHIHSLVTRSDIQTAEALRGKRIGVQLGSSTHGGLLLWLKAHGLSGDDLNIIPLSPLDMPDAMAFGQIDAMAGSEPWPTHVLSRCGNTAHRLEDFSGLGHLFPHVLMVRTACLSKYSTQIAAVVQAVSEASALINTDPESAVIYTAALSGLKPDQQHACTARLNWATGWDSTDMQSLKTTALTMQAFGKINQLPDIENFLALQSVATQ